MSDTRYRSRHAAEAVQGDDVRSKAQTDVAAAMVMLFGPSSYAEAASGGLILRVSNGTPSDLDDVNCDTPGMSEVWRRRIAKARNEIAKHSAEIRVRERAAAITVEEIEHDLMEIRIWAKSLLKAPA